MNDTPRCVRNYVWIVAATVFATFGAAVGAHGGRLPALSVRGLLLATLLVAAAAIGASFPLHLAAKTKLFFDTSALTAAAILFDVRVAMAIAVAGMAFAQWRARAPWDQALFNVAQTTLYVAAGSAVFHTLAGDATAFGPSAFGSFAAALAGITTMHLVNSVSVAGVVALHTAASPLATWRQLVRAGWPEQATLALLGVLIAAVTREHWWVLPLVGAPVAVWYLLSRRQLTMPAPAPVLITSPAASSAGD